MFSKYEISIELLSKYETFFLDQANSSFDPSQILILEYHIPKASLSLSISSMQFSSCSPSVSLFCPSQFDRTPQVLDMRNRMLSQPT